MQLNNRYLLPLLLFVCLILPESVPAEKGIPAKVAIIPFEVFSATGQPGLGQEFADMLAAKLSLNPYIYLSKREEVLSVLTSSGKELNADSLQEISRLLGVNFVLFGSITRIGDHTSVDVQLYNNFPPREYAKSFAEGSETDRVIESLAGKLELTILDKSAFIPPSQRLKVQPAGTDMDDDFIFVLEAEEGDTVPAVAATDIPVPAVSPDNGSAGAPRLQESEISQAAGVKDAAVDEGSVSAESQISEAALVAADRPESDLPMDEKTGPKKKTKKTSKKRMFKIDSPVNINADSLEYDNSENRILFSGNVVARQGDIVMFADNMDVLYNASGDLKRISAFGSVKVTQGERIAIGKSIIFYNQDQKIVVTGNPRVWQGDNVIQGKKITVFLKEDRTVVEGGPGGRVNATIYPNKMKR